jgi:apolipoprotein N-acyltransferase
VRWRSRVLVGAACVGAGLGLAASLPPWGWWPLGFLAVAAWDRLLADRPWSSRLLRSWAIGIAWLLPALLWMWDLTAPGYVVAVVVFGGYFGVAGALVPATAPARWIGLPAAIVLAEVARSHFPFEGVPLATLAMGQATAPLGQAARLGTAFLVSGLVAVGGVALSAALARRWRAGAVALTVLVVAAVAGAVAPRGHAVGETTYAIVQGGGPQRTRAQGTDPGEVLARHLAASEDVVSPVDLVVWPENVVDVDGPLAGSPQAGALSDLARRLDATVVAGVTEDVGPDRFHNVSVVVLPDGSLGDRYAKVRRVPFGEYVPLRDLVERLAGGGSGLPGRDALAGTEPAVVETPAGTLAVAISWEVFFVDRVRDGVSHGGEILLNPTNGSSYWLTQVQSQQVASSQLRAIESGRWVLQAAPTGFSAVVDPSGQVLARSDISEPWVHQGTVERRQGDTIATVTGPAPTVVAAGLALGGAWAWWWRRRPPGRREQAGAPPSAGLSPTAPGRGGRP